MAETESALAARVDELERIVLQLAELVAGVNMHTAHRMGDALKPLQERPHKKAPA